MGQDIRELFEKEQEIEKGQLEKGHESRFLQKLDKEFPASKKRNLHILWMAASVVVFFGLALIGHQFFKPGVDSNNQMVDTNTNEVKSISLGDISPDLKKVEDYYVANINYELSQIETDESTEMLFGSYMKELTELNDEYQLLSEELNDMGPNELTVSALIDNLQKRLRLLYQLKEKLQELKKSKNEQFEEKQV